MRANRYKPARTPRTTTPLEDFAAHAMQRNAKSLCYCGHKGDGWVGGQHAGVLGHGECEVRGCGCVKFSWAKFLPGMQPAGRKP